MSTKPYFRMNRNLKIARIRATRIAFPIFILILLALGCKKIFEIKEIHDKDKLCRVLTITSTTYPSPDESPSITAQFAYNKNGDPTSVTFSFVGTGRPNLIFRYDKNGRLKDYAGVYTNNFYEFWYHYQYQGDKIVSDTVYGFGKFSGDTLYPSTEFVGSEQFQYDNFGRISQVVLQFPPSSGIQPFITNYSYDNNGNLIPSNPANAVYDNKVNIHRTNFVWMFVDRNYSVNNPVKATSYNKQGLPLILNQTPPPFEGFLYNLDISKSSITYDCKGDKVN